MDYHDYCTLPCKCDWGTSVKTQSDELSLFPDDVRLRPVTNWVVGDLQTAEGRALLYQATKHLVRWLTSQTKHQLRARAGDVMINDASVNRRFGQIRIKNQSA